MFWTNQDVYLLPFLKKETMNIARYLLLLDK